MLLASGRLSTLLQVAVDGGSQGVEMGAHRAELVHALLLEPAQLLMALGVALVGVT